MNASDNLDENPYAAPKTSDTSSGDSEVDQAGSLDQRHVRRFGPEIKSLGVVWMIIGFLVLLYVRTDLDGLVLMNIGGALLAFLTVQFALTQQLTVTDVHAAGLGTVSVFVLLGIAWVALGTLTIMKRIGAVRIGLFLSYAYIVTEACRFCVVLPRLVRQQDRWMDIIGMLAALVTAAFVIRQAHRIIRWDRLMSALGPPLSGMGGEGTGAVADPVNNNAFGMAGFLLAVAVVLFFVMSVGIPVPPFALAAVGMLGVVASAIGLATFQSATQKNRWMAVTGLALNAVVTLILLLNFPR